MTKALLKKIKDPNSRWIVYLYVIPHKPHEMYYVGVSSNDIDVRQSNGYGHNKELSKAIKDAGGMKNVKVYILAANVDAPTAAALERKYIKYYHSLYNPYAPDGGYGYNKQDGGLSGFTLCQYSKDQISKAKNVPVAQIAKDENKIIAIYASLLTAEQETGTPWRQISKTINGIHYTASGYRWISLKPYLSPELIEHIFYSTDTEDIVIPLDPNVLYSQIKNKLKVNTSQGGGNCPAAFLMSKERKDGLAI